MEPPPPAADSATSSPRSLPPPDDTSSQHVAAKLRLMCSYGGHIVPRPHDKSLCYVGGDTRIVVVDRQVSLNSLAQRLSSTLLAGKPFSSLKYQLPNEDLDSLISVSNDEDLENMIDEYDRLQGSTGGSATSAAKKPPSRLRLFLFSDSKTPSFSSISVLESSAKSEDWFLNALNGATNAAAAVSGEFPESASVNSLLGLDEVVPSTNTNSKEAPGNSNSTGSNKQTTGAPQDVHSVPDSPILESTSSFGSTSSSPTMSNLPPIRVHVDDQKQLLPPAPPPQQQLAVVGNEEQFSQMVIGGGNMVQKQEDGGFFVIPATMPVQSQVKSGTLSDLTSPDSVSSDGSLTNPLSRQRVMIYQDPSLQIQNQNQNQNHNPTLNNNRAPIPADPKLSDSNPSYLYPPQFDQQIQQLNPHHQQQPHYIQPGSQYIPQGAVPAPAYYIVYPPQQQYPSAYVSARAPQAYNLQSSYAPSMNPQMGSSQNPQQFMGYSPIHHQSQSIPPSSVAATGNYTYEFTDPANPRMVYTQQMAPQMAVQYQNTAPVLSEASSQVSSESFKQQNRAAQS